MAVGAVLTATVDPTLKGSVLTFVTPAANGCGMACPFCFIDRRQEETAQSVLRPSDYADFIHQFAALGRVSAVTIQGREPLAPDSMPWTEAILAAGKAVGAETGLVTNGLYLSDNIPLLERFNLHGLTVSIDADDAAAHDRLRRKIGAWDAAMAGLTRAVAVLTEARIVVNSVILPNRTRYLRGLPQQLASIGVGKWSLSPLITFLPDGRSTVAYKKEEWLNMIGELTDLAVECGVEVIADDEFGVLSDPQLDPVTVPSALFRTLKRPDGVFRLSPDGRCSRGLSILKTSDSAAPVWRSGTSVEGLMALRAA